MFYDKCRSRHASEAGATKCVCNGYQQRIFYRKFYTLAYYFLQSANVGGECDGSL